MQTFLLQLTAASAVACCISSLFMKGLIWISPKMGLMDLPDHRKPHQHPVPPIGGIAMMLSIIVAAVFFKGISFFVLKYTIVSTAILMLLITGVADDRWGISVLSRLLIQFSCATAVACSGIRIHSLAGIMGIYDLPLILQYVFTVVVISGVTNAFNLIDGINGLAGSVSLVNMLTLALLCFFTGDLSWLFLLLPLAAALVAFLRFNWKTAKVFMGDGGSLVLGFVTATAGTWLIGQSKASAINLNTIIVLVTAMCIMPVLDAVRVFIARYKKGKSPFAADRTHLHHLLLEDSPVHSRAASKMLFIHILILSVSFVAVKGMSITATLVLQVFVIFIFMNYVRMIATFKKWYKYIKNMERVGQV